MEVGFLHPGLMGETLAANCSEAAMWASEGRSAATQDRAQAQGLIEVPSLAALCERADMVVSICPPAAAVGLAHQVADQGFTGVYVDANAISPAASRSIGERFEQYVDGSVIGPPAHNPGTTRLYLAGAAAAQVASLYEDSALDARVLDGPVGAASALKMAFASWTKIGAAMQLAIRALASAEGVDQALLDEWEISQPGLRDRTERAAGAVGPKAWRFTGEMEQISTSFATAGLPAGFADAANEIYERLAGFKGSEAPSLDQVIAALNQDSDAGAG